MPIYIDEYEKNPNLNEAPFWPDPKKGAVIEEEETPTEE